ncbi:MAG: HypC/HybG/HupF family hydrogenase formation chaperone [Planctomycetota bacterium]|nr:MAG: HypC/HybG/HupF family hydrogenase formation chaperone [Planctomycetota bacterium]
MCLGIPGKILEKYEKDGLPYAKVDFSGISKEICLAYTPEAEPGEYVLVHVGFALSRIDEAEAQETMDFIRQIEEAAEDLPPEETPTSPDGRST